MKVDRAKLTWWERLYIPSILNGFKVTMRHFFSWKRSKVYGDKQKSYRAKTTMQYPEEKWDVPTGYRGAVRGEGCGQQHQVSVVPVVRVRLSAQGHSHHAPGRQRSGRARGRGEDAG